MKSELEKLLLMKNEDFIKLAFTQIQKLSLTDGQMMILTDVDCANEKIKDRNRYTYPIVKEVPIYGEVTKDMTHVKGSRRYFDDKYFYNNKAYILCNDWYYPSEGKKNTKDTRTGFLKWIEILENEKR